MFSQQCQEVYEALRYGTVAALLVDCQHAAVVIIALLTTFVDVGDVVYEGHSAF